MKPYGQLWPQIIDFANLAAAARQAQRGKRTRPNVLAFNYNLEIELLKIHSSKKGARSGKMAAEENDQ